VEIVQVKVNSVFNSDKSGKNEQTKLKSIVNVLITGQTKTHINLLNDISKI